MKNKTQQKSKSEEKIPSGRETDQKPSDFYSSINVSNLNESEISINESFIVTSSNLETSKTTSVPIQNSNNILNSTFPDSLITATSLEKSVVSQPAYKISDDFIFPEYNDETKINKQPDKFNGYSSESSDGEKKQRTLSRNDSSSEDEDDDESDDSADQKKKLYQGIKIKPIAEVKPNLSTSPEVLREISKNIQIQIPSSNRRRKIEETISPININNGNNIFNIINHSTSNANNIINNNIDINENVDINDNINNNQNSSSINIHEETRQSLTNESFSSISSVPSNQISSSPSAASALSPSPRSLSNTSISNHINDNNNINNNNINMENNINFDFFKNNNPFVDENNNENNFINSSSHFNFFESDPFVPLTEITKTNIINNNTNNSNNNAPPLPPLPPMIQQMYQKKISQLSLSKEEKSNRLKLESIANLAQSSNLVSPTSSEYSTPSQILFDNNFPSYFNDEMKF